jgi:hypothetical protein
MYTTGWLLLDALLLGVAFLVFCVPASVGLLLLCMAARTHGQRPSEQVDGFGKFRRDR